MNWLTKIAIPLKINKQLYDIALTVSHIYNDKKTNNRLLHIDIIYQTSITVNNLKIDIVFLYHNKESIYYAKTVINDRTCFISIYPRIEETDFIETMLHELIHCIDPKLLNENLKNKNWGGKEYK